MMEINDKNSAKEMLLLQNYLFCYDINALRYARVETLKLCCKFLKRATKNSWIIGWIILRKPLF